MIMKKEKKGNRQNAPSMCKSTFLFASKGMGLPAIISLLANPQDTSDVSIGIFGTYHCRHQ